MNLQTGQIPSTIPALDRKCPTSSTFDSISVLAVFSSTWLFRRFTDKTAAIRRVRPRYSAISRISRSTSIAMCSASFDRIHVNGPDASRRILRHSIPSRASALPAWASRRQRFRVFWDPFMSALIATTHNPLYQAHGTLYHQLWHDVPRNILGITAIVRLYTLIRRPPGCSGPARKMSLPHKSILSRL